MKVSWTVVAVLLLVASTGAFAQDASSPVMEKLAASRSVEVTDAQLEELKTLQLEAIWDALGEYKVNFVTGLQTTQPGKRVVGRALTMRFLPPRPDLAQALEAIAEEKDWDQRFYGRASDEAKPGDVIVVELGGASGDHMFGDMGVLGMKLAGIRGAIVDGGSRDRAELVEPSFADFPVFARYFNIASSKWLGTDWNVPVRIESTTVLPGDIVVADESGAVFIPPQIVADVLRNARAKVSMEEFQREMLRTKRYRFSDVYPFLSPELLEEYRRRKPEN